jgi:hypothetical protein
MTWHQSMGHKEPVLMPRCIGIERAQSQLLLFIRPRALMYAPDDAARGSLPIDRTVLVAMRRLRAIYSSFFYCSCKQVSKLTPLGLDNGTFSFMCWQL